MAQRCQFDSALIRETLNSIGSCLVACPSRVPQSVRTETSHWLIPPPPRDPILGEWGLCRQSIAGLRAGPPAFDLAALRLNTTEALPHRASMDRLLPRRRRYENQAAPRIGGILEIAAHGPPRARRGLPQLLRQARQQIRWGEAQAIRTALSPWRRAGNHQQPCSTA